MAAKSGEIETEQHLAALAVREGGRYRQELKKLQLEERVLKAQDEVEMEEADLEVQEAQQKAHLMLLEKGIAEVKSSKGSNVSRRTGMGVEKPEKRGIEAIKKGFLDTRGQELPNHSVYVNKESRFTDNWVIIFCDPTLPEARDTDLDDNPTPKGPAIYEPEEEVEYELDEEMDLDFDLDLDD